MSINNIVSVIIPTLASLEREKFLFRAISSVLLQREVKTIPIVIANGNSFNPDILEKLDKRKDLRFYYLEEASQPKAIQVGRSLVETPFFSILDDDDILFPYAMITRLQPMQEKDDTDVVVTSGIIHNNNNITININDFEEISKDPLGNIDKKWMLTGASLFRTATISSAFFEGMPQYLEWTYMAVRIILGGKKISFLNIPTVIHFTDHPFSIDISKNAILGRPQAFKRILEFELPAEVRHTFETYLGLSYHAVSQVYLKERRFKLAWDSHRKMLRCRSGWKNLFFMSGIFRKVKMLLRNYT